MCGCACVTLVALQAGRCWINSHRRLTVLPPPKIDDGEDNTGRSIETTKYRRKETKKKIKGIPSLINICEPRIPYPYQHPPNIRKAVSNASRRYFVLRAGCTLQAPRQGQAIHLVVGHVLVPLALPHIDGRLADRRRIELPIGQGSAKGQDIEDREAATSLTHSAGQSMPVDGS